MNAVTDIAGRDAAPLDEDVGRAEGRLRALGRATDVGLILLDMVEAQALALRPAAVAGAEEGLAGATALSVAYSKITRSLRQNALLEDKLEAGLRDRKSGLEEARQARALKAARDAEAAREAERRAAYYADNEDRLTREAEVQEVVEKTIRRRHRGDDDTIDQLERELLDLLEEEDGDYFETYGSRPVSETVARLCDELDLKPDWERWAETDWAKAEAEAGVEGSPYVRRGVAAGSGDAASPLNKPPPEEIARQTGPP